MRIDTNNVKVFFLLLLFLQLLAATRGRRKCYAMVKYENITLRSVK